MDQPQFTGLSSLYTGKQLDLRKLYPRSSSEPQQGHKDFKPKCAATHSPALQGQAQAWTMKGRGILIEIGSKFYSNKYDKWTFRAEIMAKTYIYEIGYHSSASKTQCADFNAIYLEKNIPT